MQLPDDRLVAHCSSEIGLGRTLLFEVLIHTPPFFLQALLGSIITSIHLLYGPIGNLHILFSLAINCIL